ncbi:glycogen debranching protein [Longibacter salinarum]|uniref:Glycogen debranching protein n=1 Tax=Longibacter salinarum TaxID=1850348 RepID=A0A2A8CXT1_9BACT|nr:glycogen debranching protein [Longibacter salinarum]PEN13430.1 glycogen debranching protein [Longibacter salinarum]
MNRFLLVLGLLFGGLAGLPSFSAAQMLYDSDRFQVTDTSVAQGDFRATAPSRTMLTSNYQRERTAINFKFSINGRDNERPSGDDIRLRLSPAGGEVLTPVYVFGKRSPTSFPEPGFAAPRPSGTMEVTFRVDMKPMLRAFRAQGVYTPPSGDPIQEEDFRGLYIFGDTAPLTWNLDEASSGDRFRLTDPDGDGVYTITLSFETRDLFPLNDEGAAVWTLSEDISQFPQVESDQRLVDALYNLSLEEVLLNIREEDGAFMAGKKWTGVWTRDISYSILLSLAIIAPEQAKTSLRAKVDDAGRIIQDTGTGGSWPISSDRMTWALAAWEVYLTTGDKDWLEEIYPIIRRSAEADQHAVYNPDTGLVHGESSFMDWREQSYPDWMDPRDIYLSQTLSTNVVHARMYEILGSIAEEKGEDGSRWHEIAGSIRDGINEHLWLPEKDLYSEFRYGRNAYSAVPRTEALGSALAILTDVPSKERQSMMAQNHPVVEFGVPSFWPYIPNIPPYHNAGYWPFVGAYWTWASAEAGNTPGVEHGLGTMYRAAALFLTNKENLVAETGHFEGTQINSDRQLWSVAGTLASVYRVLFGMRFDRDGLHIQPFIPEGYTGTRTLEGVAYRDAVLDITVRGHGSRIVQITLDGQALDEPIIPADLSGQHEVRVIMTGGLPDGRVRIVENRYTPATPDVKRDGDVLTWSLVEGATAYRVIRNGKPVETVEATRHDLKSTQPASLHEYQVAAIGEGGLESFLSEPVRVVADPAVRVIPADAFAQPLESTDPGFSGDGYLPLTKEQNTSVEIELTVEESGMYAIDVRYANGHGPVNTSNKAAIRTMDVGGTTDVIVMPQRGDDVWNDWGYSNPVHVRLPAGTHTLRLSYTDFDENMNRETNAAHLDHIRLTRIGL